MTTSADPPELYTIGHSNQSLEDFVHLLRENYIQLLIDVRSYPVSKFAPHFNRPSLDAALSARAIHYRFAGKQLGGRPDGDEFYDDAGHALYARIAEAGFFRDGIEQLLGVLPRYHTAILCSEENPRVCHRDLLIGRVLLQRGVILHHVRGTGAVETDWPNADQRMAAGVAQGMLPLLGSPEPQSWRSVRPVVQRKPPTDVSPAH